MKNSYYINKPFCNVFEKPNNRSKLSTQILYGEKFTIISRWNGYFKIKTNYDNYLGYIIADNYPKKFLPNYKVRVLKACIYKEPKKTKKTKDFLSFSSEINITESNSIFFKFAEEKWIKKDDVIKKNIKIKNYLKIFKLFKNCKYVWGGKTFNGIDCSALIQLYFKYNDWYYPRDTIDQIKFKRGKRKKFKFKSGDLIYWKGHVAVCINNKNLIHAYGPMKRVVIMPIGKTIKLIKVTTGLKVEKITSI